MAAGKSMLKAGVADFSDGFIAMTPWVAKAGRKWDRRVPSFTDCWNIQSLDRRVHDLDILDTA